MATNRVWSRNPDELILNSSMCFTPLSMMLKPCELGSTKTQRLLAFATTRLVKTAFRTLGSFDRALMRVYITRSLFEKTESVAFVVNDYLVVKASKNLLVMPSGILTKFHPPRWHEDLTEADKEALGHLQVRDPSVDDFPFAMDPDKLMDSDWRRRSQRPTFNINFGEYTPLRIGRVIPVLPDIGAVQSSF
jgi:hypothetical protein